MGFETEADMSEHLWGASWGEELKGSALEGSTLVSAPRAEE